MTLGTDPRLGSQSDPDTVPPKNDNNSEPHKPQEIIPKDIASILAGNPLRGWLDQLISGRLKEMAAGLIAPEEATTIFSLLRQLTISLESLSDGEIPLFLFGNPQFYRALGLGAKGEGTERASIEE